MKNTFYAMLSLWCGFALASSAGAAATLKIGDSAPQLRVAKWVQGEPVSGFEPGKMYVVEFWATWCGPCRASIPHLNELYQKFGDKGVVVIGQDVWEQEEDGVVPFVKKMGTSMTYRVALDDKSQDKKGAMAINWMEAAGRDGIPSAFIVNKKGVIAWIGHPMTMTEKLWDDILSDHYDLKTAAADYAKEEAGQAQLAELSTKLNAAVKGQKWDEAEATLGEMEKAMPADSTAPKVMRIELSLLQKKYDAAYGTVEALSDAHPDDAGLQSRLAWLMVVRPGIEKRDPVRAVKIAERANKLTGDKDATALDTLARAQFMNGDKEKAIATEQKAVTAADPGRQGGFKRALQSFQDGKLPEFEQ